MVKNNYNNHFWEKGNGKDFIEWSGKNIVTGNYSTALFEKYDEAIDKKVEQWLKTNDFSLIMKSLHGEAVDALPPDYIALKKELEEIPAWVDQDLIKAGSELSERSGLVGLLVLRNFALLGGYNFANLTKPLVATGALEKGAVNRLTYTLDFWVNVSRTGEDAQEKRINACLRTRLVHCASRLMINKKNPHWDVEKYGVPINYADMLATNIAFTVYYLYGLNQLNYDYSKAEEKGIFHLWKYVTYLLGAPLEIIPSNKEEAIGYFKFWTQYQNQPDEDSIKLTDALLKENTPISLLKLDIIKRNMGYIHKSISNYLIDEKIRKELKIPEVRFKNIIPKAVKIKNEISIPRTEEITRGNKEQLSVLQDYKNASPKNKMKQH